MLPLINLGYTDEVIFMAGGIFIYKYFLQECYKVFVFRLWTHGKSIVKYAK